MTAAVQDTLFSTLRETAEAVGLLKVEAARLPRDTPAILHAVMTEPLPARQSDREHIEAAIRAAAGEHGGYVTAAWVRPHITRDVLPQMVGAVMRARPDFLEPTSRIERNEGGNGNALKWSPVWRLIPLDTRKS